MVEAQKKDWLKKSSSHFLSSYANESFATTKFEGEFQPLRYELSLKNHTYLSDVSCLSQILHKYVAYSSVL